MKRGHSCVRPGPGRPTGGLPGGGRLWMRGSSITGLDPCSPSHVLSSQERVSRAALPG